jgi:hypothetical protein
MYSRDRAGCRKNAMPPRMSDEWSPSIVAAATAPVAVAGVLAVALMAVIIVVAAGNAIGDQTNDRDSNQSGGRVNHLAGTPLGIVGGGATDAGAEEENGEREAMERLFHAPV